jgi:5'-3' exonuclease
MAESINSSLFLEGRKVPDYCNLAESKKFMQGMIVGTVGAKYKAEVGEFEAKGYTHTSESNYAGINDVYSLMWIDMLMAVPGVSEKKAVAIFQHYPLLTKLMDAYEDQCCEAKLVMRCRAQRLLRCAFLTLNVPVETKDRLFFKNNFCFN